MVKWFLCVLCAAFSAQALAGGTAEIQLVNNEITLDMFVAGKVSGKFGWSAFALVNKDWGQAYAGPTFSPTSWSEIGLNVGVESGGERFAESLWLGKGPISMLAIWEHGYGTNWHKITASWKFSKEWAVGFHGQAANGNGVMVAYCRQKVTIWGSVLRKGGKTNTFIALKVSN